MTADQDRLDRLLGSAELAWLIDRVRKRLARGESLATTVTLSGATPEQRAAVHRLLGRRPRPGSTLTVSLAAVDHMLRRSGAATGGLAAAVETMTGPVTDAAAAAAARERAWQEAFAPLDAVVGTHPELSAWCSGIRDTGLVRRLTGTVQEAHSLLEDLANVIENLPATGEPLGTFAAKVTNRAHALDDGRPLTTLALGAARAMSGVADGKGAEWRREVWASVGLLRDEVSSTVLTLGLPGDDQTLAQRNVAEAGRDVASQVAAVVVDGAGVEVLGGQPAPGQLAAFPPRRAPMSHDPAFTDPARYRVIFENERGCGSWSIATIPVTGPRRTVIRTGVMYTLASFRGGLTLGGRQVDLELSAGQARWLDAQEHAGENIGDTDTHAIFIELKEPAPAARSKDSLGPAVPGRHVPVSGCPGNPEVGQSLRAVRKDWE